MNEITVIYHSADFDGIFCREIAKKFLGDKATYVGWDFADKPLAIPEGEIYIMDLPVDRVFGFNYTRQESVPLRFRAHGDCRPVGLTWIDHHKSSIETHPANIEGYRIDGVAACRLAWQWFAAHLGGEAMNDMRFLGMPKKEDFISRKVSEPQAVQLAGEYDVWDKRNPEAEVFQFGLRSRDLTDEDWKWLLATEDAMVNEWATFATLIRVLLKDGALLRRYQQQQDARAMQRSSLVEWEGIKFLALNSAGGNSLTFLTQDVPETGHDALMLWYWQDEWCHVTLYHARHRTDLDLSAIAVKYGGGGHRGACGFKMQPKTPTVLGQTPTEANAR